MFLREIIKKILNFLVVRLLEKFFSLKSIKYFSTFYCNTYNIRDYTRKQINFSPSILICFLKKNRSKLRVRNFKKQIKIEGEKFQKTDQNLTKTN
jgi:hypothetical protein